MRTLYAKFSGLVVNKVKKTVSADFVDDGSSNLIVCPTKKEGQGFIDL